MPEHELRTHSGQVIRSKGQPFAVCACLFPVCVAQDCKAPAQSGSSADCCCLQADCNLPFGLQTGFELAGLLPAWTGSACLFHLLVIVLATRDVADLRCIQTYSEVHTSRAAKNQDKSHLVAKHAPVWHCRRRGWMGPVIDVDIVCKCRQAGSC